MADQVGLIRAYMATQMLHTFAVTAMWGAYVAHGVAILVVFSMLYACDIHEKCHNEVRVDIEEIGCSRDDSLLTCFLDIAIVTDRGIDPIRAWLSQEKSKFYMFPFNRTGAIIFFGYILFVFFLSILLLRGGGWKYEESNVQLLRRFKKIGSFENAIEVFLQHRGVKVFSLQKSEPVTFGRTIYVPIEFFHEWNFYDGEIGEKIQHSLHHEYAHANVLFPFEGINRSIYVANFLIFFIIMLPIGIGIVTGPISAFFQTFTYKKKIRIYERLADAVANAKLKLRGCTLSRSRGFSPLVSLKISSAISLLFSYLLILPVSKSSIFGDFRNEFIMLFGMVVLLDVLSSVFFFLIERRDL